MTKYPSLNEDGERMLHDRTRTTWATRVGLARVAVADRCGVDIWDVTDEDGLAELASIDGCDLSELRDPGIGQASPPVRTPMASPAVARVAPAPVSNRISERREVFDDEDRRETAYHEAGHAIAAIAVGAPLDQVCVFHGDNGHGERGVTVYGEGISRIRPIDRNAIAYAGDMAVRLVGGMEPTPGGNAGDVANVRHANDRLDAQDDISARIKGKVAAERIVRGNAARIQTLADYLYKWSEITGEEVEAMFRASERGAWSCRKVRY